MAFITADRVLETSTTTGTGSYTLAGTISGFTTFASQCANGDTCIYYAEDVNVSGIPSGSWEIGTGTWGTGGILARTAIIRSSNANAAVSWAAGTRRIAITLDASTIVGKANLASPTFTGTPAAPTAATATNTTQIATTAYVKAQAYATLASPALTGTPTSTTAAANTNTTQIATTAFVIGQAYAPLASPSLTGTPLAPTASTGTNTTQIATTAYVKAQAYATLASPALTGTPTAPTASTGTNTTQIATTAYVKAQGYATLASPTFTGTVAGITSTMVPHADPVAPAYVKTLSDMANGDEVSLFRFIPPAKHSTISAQTETSNLQTNIQDAINAMATYGRGGIFVPGGLYYTDQITFGSNMNFRGSGMNTVFIPFGSTITGNKWFLISSKTNVNLSNFQLYAERATFTAASCIFVDSSAQIKASDILISASAAFGINTSASSQCDFERITVNEAQQIGIYHSGGSNIHTRNCVVSNVYTSHGIQNVSGSDHAIIDCTTFNCTQMGAQMYNVGRGKIINHRTWDTKLEGINLLNCNNCDIVNPSIFWTGNATWASTDFGMSIWGDNNVSGLSLGTFSNFNKIIGGQINSPAKSGFAIADNCQFNTVDGLSITNPNSLDETEGAAVLFYGSGTVNNKVSNLQSWAGNGKMRHAVNEQDSGGRPSSNTFYQIDSSGHTGVKVQKSNSSRYINDLNNRINVKDFGAYGDGTTHPLSAQYATLAAAQVVYPFAAALTEEIDGCAIQAAINYLGTSGGEVYLPKGTYRLSTSITIGDGTSSAASTIRGVRLVGEGVPRPQYALAGMATTATTKLVWASASVLVMIKLAGPLVGWGVDRIEFEGSGVASAGLHVVSAAFGSCQDLSFKGCKYSILSTTVANTVSGVDNVDSLHNRFDNISIEVPNVTGAIGIHCTGLLNSNTDYCHFTNVVVTFATGSNVVYGIYLASCDSNQFHNVHFFGGNGSATCVALDYTINNVWPASNAFYGVDTGALFTSWANISTPGSGARPNLVHGVVETNNAVWPTTIDNLISCIPAIKAKKALKTQSTSIGATNLFTAWAEGDYRITYYLATEVSSGTATVASTIFFNDAAGQLRSVVIPSISMAAANYTQGSIIARMAIGTAQYTTTVTGTIGTARYQIFFTVERLT